MKSRPLNPAALAQPTPQDMVLSGAWTARGISAIEPALDALPTAAAKELVADGSQIDALDTAGAWVLQKLLLRLRGEGISVNLRG